MCLISKWRFPKKAKKDIICFKVLKKPQSFQKDWYTPYRWEPVNFNDWIIANECITFSILNPYDKGPGYVHAYSDKKFVRKEYVFEERTFVALIPKGTRYHISKDGKEICAKRMFITNECLD